MGEKISGGSTMVLKQFLYLGHWIVKLDYGIFTSQLNYAHEKSNKSKLNLLFDIMYSVLWYRISIMEYFQFNFYSAKREERNKYVGTPLLEEFQLIMNPKSDRDILHNKIKFIETYATFIKHSHATLADLRAQNENALNIMRNRSGKIVLKSLYGEGGKGIEVVSLRNIDLDGLIDRLILTGNDYVEECVQQHKKLMQLSPSGLNTLRIITQLNTDDEVVILGTILRISVNCAVDNWHAGNIAAPIDYSTGIIEGPAFYMDATKPEVYYHPITNTKIVGFEIPYWPETIKMVKEAAILNKKNRSIGWDFAITDNGPDIIEGNHNWCKVLWQRSARKGLKPLISAYW